MFRRRMLVQVAAALFALFAATMAPGYAHADRVQG